MTDKQKLFGCGDKKPPVVLLADGLSSLQECNGTCAYYGETPRPCTIILDPKSNDPSKVLIHEYIHAALFNMKTNPALEKLADKINRREDFIEGLSEELSLIFKFGIADDSPLAPQESIP